MSNIHDANAITLGKFGGWHVFCCCSWPSVEQRADLRRRGLPHSRSLAERAVFDHLRQAEPERAHRYALEKGLSVP